MKIKSFRSRDPDLSTATVAKIEALSRKIDRLIALDKARANVRKIKQAGQRSYRGKGSKPAAIVAPVKVAPSVTGSRLPALALTWRMVPNHFRRLAIGQSIESIWSAESSSRSLPSDLYRVDPGPPVMVTRIAADPLDEAPAGMPGDSTGQAPAVAQVAVDSGAAPVPVAAETSSA